MTIELALIASSGDLSPKRKQEDDNRALGLTGAEIDLARRGLSFDVKIVRAIAFALTANGNTRARARAAGLCERSCVEIEHLAAAGRQVAGG